MTVINYLSIISLCYFKKTEQAVNDILFRKLRVFVIKFRGNLN